MIKKQEKKMKKLVVLSCIGIIAASFAAAISVQGVTLTGQAMAQSRNNGSPALTGLARFQLGKWPECL